VNWARALERVDVELVGGDQECAEFARFVAAVAEVPGGPRRWQI
jgi:hypothetical protein